MGEWECCVIVTVFVASSALIGLHSHYSPRLILGQYRHQQLLGGGTRVLDLSGSSSQHYRPSPAVLSLSPGSGETLSVWISRVRGRMRG